MVSEGGEKKQTLERERPHIVCFLLLYSNRDGCWGVGSHFRHFSFVVLVKKYILGSKVPHGEVYRPFFPPRGG